MPLQLALGHALEGLISTAKLQRCRNFISSHVVSYKEDFGLATRREEMIERSIRSKVFVPSVKNSVYT